jgi:hypothetical protein
VLFEQLLHARPLFLREHGGDGGAGVAHFLSRLGDGGAPDFAHAFLGGFDDGVDAFGLIRRELQIPGHPLQETQPGAGAGWRGFAAPGLPGGDFGNLPRVPQTLAHHAGEHSGEEQHQGGDNRFPTDHHGVSG